ncbi:MAG: hypothetical protein EBS06_02970 [Proteobacteria bacterium]|nr:hypothetical protein [Pseudomonadota bacterium]
MLYQLYQVFSSLYFFSVLIFFLVSCPALALDSESDREKIVSAKSRKFYKSSRAVQSFLLSGNKDSDYNSKSYQIDSRYYYQSDKFLNEINFFQKTSYAEASSGAKKNELVKKSELYDVMGSSKFLLSQSNNYAVLYGRVNYDELSSYYYDLRSAAGFGRIFFDDKIELDASIGYIDIKNSGSKTFLLPSIRMSFPITRNLILTQRAYWFIDYESMDDDIRTTLKYRINSRFSLALNHIFEQRKYENSIKNAQINQTRRYISVGFVFDLQ